MNWQRITLVSFVLVLAVTASVLAYGKGWDRGYVDGVRYADNKPSLTHAGLPSSLQPAEAPFDRVPTRGHFAYIDPHELSFGVQQRAWGLNPIMLNTSPTLGTGKDGRIMKLANVGGKLMAEVPPFCFDNTVGYFKKVDRLPTWYAQVVFTDYTCGLG